MPPRKRNATEKELNEKLARWAGFTVAHIGVNGEIEVWLEPDDNNVPETPMEYYHGGKDYSLPSFTVSLDACKQWLFPKVFEKGYDIYLFSDDEFFFAYMVTNDLEHKRCFDSVAGVLEPALAICKSVEQLADRKEKP